MSHDATTYWDGVPAVARRCLVEVEDPGRRPLWYADLIGRERPAVEVLVPTGVSGLAVGRPGEVLFIDDERGWGWRKVTECRGARGVVSGLYHRVRVVGYYD